MQGRSLAERQHSASCCASQVSVQQVLPGWERWRGEQRHQPEDLPLSHLQTPPSISLQGAAVQRSEGKVTDGVIIGIEEHYKYVLDPNLKF